MVEMPDKRQLEGFDDPLEDPTMEMLSEFLSWALQDPTKTEQRKALCRLFLRMAYHEGEKNAGRYTRVLTQRARGVRRDK